MHNAKKHKMLESTGWDCGALLAFAGSVFCTVHRCFVNIVTDMEKSEKCPLLVESRKHQKGPMKSSCIIVYRNRIQREKFDFWFFTYPIKFLDPFISKKKNLPIIGFMVLKTTALSSRFQRKNRFWKMCTGSRDINQNVPKFRSPNQTCIFWEVLANISGLGAYFSKPIFALKP